MRTVCGQFCGIFGGFFAVVGPILHERCLSQVVPLCLVCQKLHCRGLVVLMTLDGLVMIAPSIRVSARDWEASFVSVCSNSECERNGCQNLTCRTVVEWTRTRGHSSGFVSCDVNPTLWSYRHTRPRNGRIVFAYFSAFLGTFKKGS